MALVHQLQGHPHQHQQQTMIYQPLSNYTNMTGLTNMSQLQSSNFNFSSNHSSLPLSHSLDQHHHYQQQQQQQQQQHNHLQHQQQSHHLQHQQLQQSPPPLSLSLSPRTCPSPADSCESGGANVSQSGSRRTAPTLATGRRNLKGEIVTPEEDRRRAMRREKNRRAAAKCRQKRQDCIASLEEEVQELEQSRMEVEQQVQQLQNEAHQLLSVLEAHSENCHMIDLSFSQIKTSFSSMNKIQSMTSLSPVHLQIQQQRPNDLPLPVLRPAPTLTCLETPELMTPATYQPSLLPSVTASWETGGLGLTPLLSGLDTPKGEHIPFPGLIEIKSENDYVTL